MKPKLSLVIPTYNVSKYIEKTLDSVGGQTLDPSLFETIIVDDGSMDGTPGIIEEQIKNMGNVVYERMGENKGVSFVINKGISVSSSGLIALLGADDLLEKNAIEESIKFMDENPNVQYSYSQYSKINKNGDFLSSHPPLPFSKENIFHFNHVGSIMCFTKEVHDKIGGFDEKILYGQDWDHVLRASLVLGENQIKQNPMSLYKYRVRPGSISTSKYEERKKCAEKFISSALKQKGINARVSYSHKTPEGHGYYDWEVLEDEK